MPVDADLKPESASADRDVSIRQHYDALDLQWHDFLVDDPTLNPR
jgi:hypothetical protein